MKKMILVLVLAGLLGVAFPMQVGATGYWKACIDIEKKVSVDGGYTFVDADTCNEAPTADGSVEYKLTVKNCGNATLKWVEISDPALGIKLGGPGSWVAEKLEPGESKTFTRHEIPQLFVEDACALADVFFNNTASVQAYYLDQWWRKITDSDAACVKCEDQFTPCIDIEKKVSVDGGHTFVDADTCYEAPTAEGSVEYKLTVKNCGEATLEWVEINDKALGIVNLWVGTLEAGESRKYDRHWTPALFVGDACALDPEFIKNTATVRAYYHDDWWRKITDSDAACVKCEDKFSRLGDRVWVDLNGNGIQDCTDDSGNGIIGDEGDMGPECRPAGIPGVRVELVDCQTSGVLATDFTDEDGFYLFDDLTPGQYCVRFDLSTVPTDVCDFGLPQFTTANVGNNDALDSDADPATGVTAAVNLAAGQTNRSVDAGIVCQECAITIDKKCLVAPSPPGPFVCSDAKPIDSLTMVWGGADGIRIRAWKGNVGSTLLADIDNIQPGEEVTVSGFAGSPNDVYWEVFFAGTNSKIGESTFHLSCSDGDMNGPEDCGKSEGDGKDKSGFINDWIFEGMAGSGLALDCTPADLSPADECEFEASPPPDCETLGKPRSLTFRYTGADCSASQNSQPSDKWDCSNVPGTGPVSIAILKDPNKITVSPSSGIAVGDLVTVSATGSDMGSEVQLFVGGQFLKFHTSCSQPLAAGDVFGSLELLQFNGQGSGAEVTYFYEVTNLGNVDVAITSVADDKLGELLGTSVQLPSGGAFSLQKTAFISETTTNEVTARADLLPTGVPCGEAKDQLTVRVVAATCDVAIAFDKLEDDKIKWRVTNTSKITATLETLIVNFPTDYGAIKEVKLDGGIFKKDDSVAYPNGVPPGAAIGPNTWTNADVSKRQIDPGETRTLEIVFTQKSKGGGWVDIDSAGTATFKEGCALLLIKPSP